LSLPIALEGARGLGGDGRNHRLFMITLCSTVVAQGFWAYMALECTRCCARPPRARCSASLTPPRNVFGAPTDLLVPADAVPHTLGGGLALLGSFSWWSAAGALLGRMWAGHWSWIALVATWTLLNAVWLSLLTIAQVR